ncbi:hypothetical protein L5F32_05130 [Aliarcobacter butzleri]|uniref:hypothetical protein n=1 Tax=Aliarcobacter butzleri TaxID=28197 RepID=UPI001EDA8693|nr:hypothetical protein [Aliarcobacter butzleri]MCG3651653.1 hypothetical protein [Aliarcobacter butzleri]
MKKFLQTILTIATITFLTGCGEEAKAKVSECNKLEKTNEKQELDCKNAKTSLLMERDTNSGYKKADDINSFSKLPGTKTENPYK